MSCDSQSDSILQHQDSSCANTSNKHLLGKNDDNTFIIKNKDLVNQIVETSGQHSQTDFLDGQQDSEFFKDKEEIPGKEVLLIMQALKTLSTTEEKLAALCKKCIDLLEDKEAVEKQIWVLKKKQAQTEIENMRLQSEHSKTILTRSKLESLCRELQHHNKSLKEENMKRAQVEEESRKKAIAHFQITLNEIQTQLEQQHIHNTKLQQENIDLGEKLKKLIEQYELREKHVDKVFKHKDLEQKLVDAKLQQTRQLLKEIEERHQKERDFLLREVTESRHKYDCMKLQEAQLKQQISFYMGKFEEFQTTMTESNELFISFRQEMKKMTKKIKKLEKETIIWRTKWENNNEVLLKMAEEKIVRDKEYQTLQIKLQRLEKLCRALKIQRNELRKKIEVLQNQLSLKITVKSSQS
ncbi:gamma-taxilin-like [Tenrec ecaudatus]|uniref:gamma-taxilin-like n=1 Tax=Tenrec ecaudatus TaxID=94439 RepID=UPI003F597638